MQVPPNVKPIQLGIGPSISLLGRTFPSAETIYRFKGFPWLILNTMVEWHQIAFLEFSNQPSQIDSLITRCCSCKNIKAWTIIAAWSFNVCLDWRAIKYSYTSRGKELFGSKSEKCNRSLPPSNTNILIPDESPRWIIFLQQTNEICGDLTLHPLGAE